VENDQLLEKFLSAKRIEGCSEKSLKYYAFTIRHMLEAVSKPLREINTDDLRRYLAMYQQERNAGKVTIDNIRRIFSSFFGWLEDYILKSPVRRIRRIKTDKTIKDTFTDEGLELLRDTCGKIRDLAIVDLLASTGMRVDELVLLTRKDINFNERECVVFGKGNRERVVYFDARTKIHLQNYLESRTDDNPALFVSLTKPHKCLMIGGVETRLRELGKQAAPAQIQAYSRHQGH
jgi:site-specific recombinase XerD